MKGRKDAGLGICLQRAGEGSPRAGFGLLPPATLIRQSDRQGKQGPPGRPVVNRSFDKLVRRRIK
jgi:hypothetical protein